MRIENKGIKILFLFLLDGIGLTLAYGIALAIRYGSLALPEYMRGTYLFIYIGMMISGLLADILLNQSRNYIHRGNFVEATLVTQYNAVIMVIIGLLIFLVQAGKFYSRLVFVYQVIGNEILLLGIRVLVKHFLRMHTKSERMRVKLVVIAESQKAETLLEELEQAEGICYEYVGIVLWDKTPGIVEQIGRVPVLAGKRDALEILKGIPMDQAFISLPPEAQAEAENLIYQLEIMGVTCQQHFIPYQREVYPQKYDTIGNFKVLTYSIQNIPYEKLMIKRAMDVLGGIVGLLITTILFPFVALAIKIDSKGPVLFSQERMGKNGRKFRIYKFRSMCQDAEQKKEALATDNEMQGLMFKMEKDPRITKVGAFLRKTSIDELPQFYNVLVGEMSLVGTRPPTVDEFEKYSPYHRRRLCMTPGLTGMWQVSGRSQITNFEDVVKLDLQYIDQWSIGLDMKILFQTIGTVLFHKGAA